MPECFACHTEITDLKDQDILEIIGNDPMESGRLLKTFNHTLSIEVGPNRSYIHIRCASKHADLLGRYHRKEWLEWRTRQLEKENIDLKHKTETMKEEIVRLMQKAENQPQEIEDFLKGFAFYNR